MSNGGDSEAFPIERVVLSESHAHGNEENDSGDGEQDDADRQEHALGSFMVVDIAHCMSCEYADQAQRGQRADDAHYAECLDDLGRKPLMRKIVLVGRDLDLPPYIFEAHQDHLLILMHDQLLNSTTGQTRLFRQASSLVVLLPNRLMPVHLP